MAAPDLGREETMNNYRIGLSAALGVFTCLAAGGLRGEEGGDLLAAFLAKAKVQGYASGDESRVRTLADGGREVASSDGEYAYRDRWYGESRFSGEEIVWHKGKAVWSMNFFGTTSAGVSIPPDFSRFHKSALRHVTAESPLRGPALHREGEFVYVNDVTGSLRNFGGVERVFYRDQEICRLVYHGGLLSE
jgi:hypothetical protein